MNYFVSIENTHYFHWQIELLIKSFKLHNLQNSLYIGVSEGDGLTGIDPVNFKSHPNKILNENYDKINNIKGLNPFCNLLAAVQSNLIQLPIAFIHSDMVLKQPLPDITDDILFSVDDSYDDLRPLVENYTGELPVWFPVGGVLVFNKDPRKFLNTVISRISQGELAKTAVLLALYEHLNEYSVTGEPIESGLLHNEVESNFIHYGKGVPPHFSKRHYYPNSIIGNPKGPFAALLDINSTTNIRYIHKLIV
jgi:hypothetical protein